MNHNLMVIGLQDGGITGRAVQDARGSDPPGDLRATVPRGRTDRVDAHRGRRHLAARCLQTPGRTQGRGPGARPARGPRDPLQRPAARAATDARLDESLWRVLARAVRPAGRFAQQDGSMTKPDAARSVVIEREMPHPPEKVWRALTQPHLIAEWLMKNDFTPAVDPNKRLSYTWAALGLESVVTWTLTATSRGTHLRMEQSGFRPDQQQAYQGAQYGWPRVFAGLEQVLARMN